MGIVIMMQDGQLHGHNVSSEGVGEIRTEQDLTELCETSGLVADTERRMLSCWRVLFEWMKQECLKIF
jgi:hypothetical protein